MEYIFEPSIKPGLSRSKCIKHLKPNLIHMQNKTQTDFDFVFNTVCYVVKQFFLNKIRRYKANYKPLFKGYLMPKTNIQNSAYKYNKLLPCIGKCFFVSRKINLTPSSFSLIIYHDNTNLNFSFLRIFNIPAEVGKRLDKHCFKLVCFM